MSAMMAETWFPLLIAYVDLADSIQPNLGMAKQIKNLYAESEPQRTSTNTAWTGDIHNVEKIHYDTAFAWLTEQVGQYAFEYLKFLGHDLTKIDLYIQRAWPIISKKGQYLARHAHHNAHLSAVYYVTAPKEGDGGKIRFYNDAKQNELWTGIGSSMTNGYSEYNFTNYQTASYEPIAGRLLMFPSKQTHDIAPNETEEDRISISYDLVLTSRKDNSPGYYEFLMPPPAQWQKVTQSKHQNSPYRG